MKPPGQGSMPSYCIHMDVPRGGVSPAMASTAGPLPSGDGRWPWARPDGRTFAASPNGHPRNRPQPVRRSRSDTGFPWGRNGPDMPDLSGGLSGSHISAPVVGEHTPGPFYDMERAGGKYTSMVNKVEFMPLRHGLMREDSEMRFRGEGGKAYGLYTHQGKDIGLGVTHPTWLDPQIEERKEPQGFCQGSSEVAWPWGRDGRLRIPEDPANSWILLNNLGEPENELLEVDKRAQVLKSNGQRKGALILKADRPMAPWLKATCRY